jgi:hypothetical protein
MTKIVLVFMVTLRYPWKFVFESYHVNLLNLVS